MRLIIINKMMFPQKKFHWSVYAVIIITCISLLIDIIANIKQVTLHLNAGIESYNDYPLNIFLDFLAIVGFILFLKQKSLFNYFVLLLILIFKLLFGIQQGTDISYEYLIGANFPKFILEFLPLTVVLFVKNNGLSGWKSLNHILSRKKINSISFIFQTICFGGIFLFSIYINSKEYPDYVNTFSKKASVFFGFHNNKLADISLQRAQKAGQDGLLGKTQYYLGWCEKMNPDKKETLCKIAQYYMEERNIEQALIWYKKALGQSPNDNQIKTSYALCLSFSDPDSAIQYAEELIEIDSNNEIAACILRDYYEQESNDDLAFYWGLRVFNLKEDRQEDKDIEVFSRILSKIICFKDYHNHDNIIIPSSSISVQPIGLSNKDYLRVQKKFQEKNRENGTIALFMHNMRDIEFMDNSYYFVCLPDSQYGQIWSSEKVKRNLSKLIQEYPKTAIFSLIVIK